MAVYLHSSTVRLVIYEKHDMKANNEHHCTDYIKYVKVHLQFDLFIKCNKKEKKLSTKRKLFIIKMNYKVHRK